MSHTKSDERKILLTRSNALNRMTPFTHGREIVWQITWFTGTASKARDIFDDHKLAPNATWDEKGLKASSFGNCAYRSITKKKSTPPVFEGEGVETIYWIIPGARTPPVVERKKILQSRFDSARVVNETLPIVYFEWRIIVGGIGRSKSSRYIESTALRARSDNVMRCCCRFGGAGDNAIWPSTCEVMTPANASRERSFVACSMMASYFCTAGIPLCCRSSDLKLTEAQKVSSIVPSSSPKLIHEPII